jgi:hypothetical protein
VSTASYSKVIPASQRVRDGTGKPNKTRNSPKSGAQKWPKNAVQKKGNQGPQKKGHKSLKKTGKKRLLNRRSSQPHGQNELYHPRAMLHLGCWKVPKTPFLIPVFSRSTLFNGWHSRSWKAVNPRYFLACIDYFRDEGPKKAGYSLRDKVVEVTLIRSFK